MSPHAVSNFVGDLVEMAKAYEELPNVRKELAQADRMLNELSQTVQQRELHIIELKAEIDKLHSTVREAEVAKDAAETMFLEADDRTARALDFIKATFGNAGSLIQALEPPKPIEPPQVASSHEALIEGVNATVHADYPASQVASTGTGESVNNPTPQAEHSSQSDGGMNTGEAISHATHDAPPVPEVAAQPDPTAAGQATLEHQSATSEPAALPMSAASIDGPYSSRRYIDVPGWINRDDWKAGGGTDESYDYRPGRDPLTQL